MKITPYRYWNRLIGTTKKNKDRSKSKTHKKLKRSDRS